MTAATKRLLPTKFELGALGILSILVLFLGNSKALLDYYGLDASTHIVHQSTQHVVGNGLTFLDDYSFTGRAVTFAIWAFIGLICYSIVISMAQGLQTLHQGRLMSSGRYIHPTNFTKQGFWRQVILSFILLLATIVVLGVVLYGFFAVALPVGLKYGHELLFHSSLTSVGGFLVAAIVVYIWLLLIDVCLRVLAQRHHFST